MTAIICSEAVLRRIADRVDQQCWSVLSPAMKAKIVESAIYAELEIRHPNDTIEMRELVALRLRACRRLMSEPDLAAIGMHDMMGY